MVWWAAAIGAAMTALGGWMLARGVRDIWMGRRSRAWPTAPGRVTATRISQGEFWHFYVDYRYEVAGISYEGKGLRAGQPTVSPAEAKELERQYAVGTDVVVHYDPARPGMSVLVPGLGSGAFWGIVVAMIFLGFGLGFLAQGVVGHQSSQSSDPKLGLPFADLNDPTCIAVDSAGVVYVCDTKPIHAVPPTAAPTAMPTGPLWPEPVEKEGRLLQLPPDSARSRQLLPFGGLNTPTGLAVDSSGAIYVADAGAKFPGPLGMVLKLTREPNPGGGTKITGTTIIPRLLSPGGVAVDSAGTVYVTERSTGQVLQLPTGATTATELFKGPDSGTATDVAVDSANNVYVTDNRNSRVLKLAAGGTAPTQLPFAGLLHPQGVAVDTAGNVYVVDSGNHRVLKLAAGSDTPTELPFTGLKDPYDVAVDTAGNVYVTDKGNRRVLKIPPQ